MASKNLYWFKLKNTYFNQLVQKKMKRQKNGKDMQIIYLRMLLLSLDNQGYIHYQGIYDSIEEELAEEFDESIELVKATIDFLVSNNMIVRSNDKDQESYYIPEAIENVGKECDSAERVRQYRERKALQCNGDVTQGNAPVTTCNTDKIKDKSKVREDKELDNTLYNSLTLKEGDMLPPPADAGGASPFTLMDCKQCADEGKVNLSANGIAAFYSRMEKDNWKIKGVPVENLLKAMRGFSKNYKKYQKEVSGSENSKNAADREAPETSETEIQQEPQEEYEPTEEEYTKWLEEMGYKTKEE